MTIEEIRESDTVPFLEIGDLCLFRNEGILYLKSNNLKGNTPCYNAIDILQRTYISFLDSMRVTPIECIKLVIKEKEV